MSFEISIAHKENLQRILELQKECYLAEAVLYNEYNIPPLTQTLASITEEFEQDTLFLISVAGDQVIASVRGYIRNETAYIGRLMVKKHFQNKGLGQAMMKEIEQRLSDCKRYELFTGFKSEKNLLLYQKLNYKELKRVYITDNLTLVYLEKYR